MKKVVKLFFLCIILILIFLRLYYNRSIRASIAEVYLKFTIKKLGKEEMENLLIKRAEKNPSEYVLNPNLKNISESKYGKMKVLTINKNGKGKLIYYLHGGSYLHDPDPYHFKMLNKIVEKTDAVVVMPIYPKAPWYDFKDAYNNVLGLYREISQKSDVVLMGDSAGGGFALGLISEINRLKLKKEKMTILISPWLDLTMTNPKIQEYQKVDPWLNSDSLKVAAKFWAKGANLKDPRLSPIYANLSLYKDVVIFTGTRDILYPDILLFSEKLNEKNIDHKLIVGKNLNHDYPLFPIPEAKNAIDMIISIIKKGSTNCS